MLEKILMKPEVRTMSITALFDYVKVKAGEKTIDKIIETIGIDKFRIKSKTSDEYEDLRKYHLLNDSDYFISNELSLVIFGTVKKFLPGENAIFEAGRYAVKRFPDIKKRIAWVKLVSPNYLFNKATKENSKYNKTKQIFLDSKTGEVTLKVEYLQNITTHDGVFLTKDICDWNKGLYYGYMELTGATDITIEEKECITEGKPYCVFIGKWKDPPLKKKLKNFLAQKWFSDVIEDYQTAIEERDISVLTLEQIVKNKTNENRLLLLQLSEVDKLKFTQQILAKAKHELNNPLTVIRGAIDRISETYAGVKEGLTHTQEIYNAWDKLAANIEKVYTAANESIPIFENADSYLKEIQKIQNGEPHDKHILSDMANALSNIKNAEITGLDALIEESMAEMINFRTKVESFSKKALKDDEDITSGITAIDREITNMKNVIKIIEEYAKVGKYKTGTDIINITSFLSDYTTRYKTTFEKEGIKFSVEGQPDLYVKSDTTQLYEIFDNLINNANESMQSKEIKELRVIISKKEVSRGIAYATVEVKDTGKGFNPKDKDDIFLPFRSTKDSKLSGLGLGIVKSIISTNGGFVDCESTLGAGASFYINLPIYEGGRNG